MASSSEKDNASRTRIINHMNADHQDSIARYLEHYAGKSTWEAASGRMIYVDLDGMTLATTRDTDARVRFSPPLTSYAQARERLVELDRECVTALKRSDVTIREFLAPTTSLAYTLEFCALAVVLVVCSRQTVFEDGGIVAAMVGQRLARFCWVMQPYVWWFLVVAHCLETLFFTRTLKKHSVNPRSAAYWQWCATTLIEGTFSIMRFKNLVLRTQEANAKRKH